MNGCTAYKYQETTLVHCQKMILRFLTFLIFGILAKDFVTSTDSIERKLAIGPSETVINIYEGFGSYRSS